MCVRNAKLVFQSLFFWIVPLGNIWPGGLSDNNQVSILVLLDSASRHLYISWIVSYTYVSILVLLDSASRQIMGRLLGHPLSVSILVLLDSASRPGQLLAEIHCLDVSILVLLDSASRHYVVPSAANQHM